MTIPLDPVLPADFYNTPNDERSESEIEQWWDRPYACTNPDGTLAVRCLDGGAWDRPTFYGQSATMQEACLLADRKLATWRWLAQNPVYYMGENTLAMVTMPRRPHQEHVVLAEFSLGDHAAANAWKADWLKRNPKPGFE